MSNYIIAGEAGNPDLSDCEFLGKKLESSTPNAHVHIISKHSSEWDNFLRKICNSYGFKEPSNPIIFTVDGKLIGDKYAFKEHVVRTYSVRGELDKNMRALISEFDKTSLDNFRQKQAEGLSVKDQVVDRLAEVISEGGIRILDGFFQPVYDRGHQFWVKHSNMLSPFTYDDFDQWGESLEFMDLPELLPAIKEVELFSPKESRMTEDFPEDEEKEDEKGSESPVNEKEKSRENSPLLTGSDDVNSGLIGFELDDRNFKNFIEYFTNTQTDVQTLSQVFEVQTPAAIKTVPIFNGNIVRDLPRDYLLAVSPFPLIPGEMVVFSGKMVEGAWLLRDFSMMQNWIKVITIPPQKPVYRDGDIVDPAYPKEPIFVKELNSNCMSQRGYTCRTIDLNLECSRDSSLRCNSINIYLRHVLTECDWEIWVKVIKDLGAIGYYQLLPYGEMNFHPIRSGQMLVSMLPISGISLVSFEELIEKYGDEQEIFTVPEFKFDHLVCNFPKNANARMINEFYLMAIEKMNIEKKKIDCGLNIVVLSGFMMIVPIYRPYASVQGRNIYPDPLWYVGVQSLPILPKVWPETAGEVKKRSPFELLEYCSSFNL